MMMTCGTGEGADGRRLLASKSANNCDHRPVSGVFGVRVCAYSGTADATVLFAVSPVSTYCGATDDSVP